MCVLWFLLFPLTERNKLGARDTALSTNDITKANIKHSSRCLVLNFNVFSLLNTITDDSVVLKIFADLLFSITFSTGFCLKEGSPLERKVSC